MGDKIEPISDKNFNSLIKDQLYDLDETLSLAIKDYARIPLLIQTVHGRAIKGHGFFKNNAKPEITMDEICLACDIDPQIMRGYKQQIAYDTIENAKDIFNGKKRTLTNRLGEPLGGVEFLLNEKIIPSKELFKGYVIGARMDNFYWREYTKSIYPKTLDGKEFKIGSGKEYLIDKEKLKDFNIMNVSLSEIPHSEEKIKEYKKNGIIVKDNNKNNSHIENKFIRRNKGLGVCDDRLMIASGRKYGPSAMRALFVTDMLDTHTKFNNDRISGGEDEFLGNMIEKMWYEKYNEEIITPNETAELIYLGAKNNMKIGIHSSSHRYFVQKENNHPLATFLRHENFVKYGKVGNFKLGFERLESKLFYENMTQRFVAINKIGTVDKNDYTVLTK